LGTDDGDCSSFFFSWLEILMLLEI
jgi:hypothetical protein